LEGEFLRTSLSVALEWAAGRLLRIAGVGKRAVGHARTFLVAWKVAEVVCTEMKERVDAYDLEFLVLAARRKVTAQFEPINASDPYASAVPSIERLRQCAMLVRMIVRLGIGKVTTVVRMIRSV
jgi:hypothetical protein